MLFKAQKPNVVALWTLGLQPGLLKAGASDLLFVIMQLISPIHLHPAQKLCNSDQPFAVRLYGYFSTLVNTDGFESQSLS